MIPPQVCTNTPNSKKGGEALNLNFSIADEDLEALWKDDNQLDGAPYEFV